MAWHCGSMFSKASGGGVSTVDTSWFADVEGCSSMNVPAVESIEVIVSACLVVFTRNSGRICICCFDVIPRVGGGSYIELCSQNFHSFLIGFIGSWDDIDGV